MSNLRNDIYTENDIKESIDNGNVYKKPNIKCELTEIIESIDHPDEPEYKISFKTMYVECALGSPVEPITEGYMFFKDDSYIKLVLKPDWSTGTLPLVTNMRFQCFFGIKDSEGVITEYGIASATGIPATKHFYEYNPTTRLWDMTEIIYQTGDKFRLYIGWWNEPSPKLRTIFAPYISGGGTFSLESYNNVLSRNTLSSGFQSAFYIDSIQGQIIASYLCGDTTEGTKYPGEDSNISGGEGTFYNRNDEVDFTPIPSLQAIDLGFTTLYNPNPSDVRAFAAWLWSDDFTENIKMNYSDPLNNILGINFIALPENMITNELANFVVGNCDSGIQTLKVTSGNKNQYVRLDCGEVILPEYWQNFLDYNSSFQIWLPYIGFRQLKPDDILQATEDTGGSLKVKYIIDLLTGCAVCEIVSILQDRSDGRLVKHLLYSYNCNCFYSTPISGANFMSMYNQQLSATSSGISNLVSSVGQMLGGGLAGAAGGLVNLFTGQQQAKREYETAKPEYGRAGNSGGSSGYFSYKKPYIVKSNPIGQTPKNYNSLEGIPSMIFRKLSDLEGYTEINAINLDSINASSAEKSELLTIMKSGFYI